VRRRDFIKGIVGSTVVWPLATRAQQSAMPVIGFLGAGSMETDAFRVTSFRQGLRETGYVEGQNVTIEYRWAEGHLDRLPALAADLVHTQPAVIATTSAPATLAAKVATTTIPIVFETGANPVELGLVDSLSQPGGNVTGVTQMADEVAPKRLELLHEVMPTASVMALLVNPADPAVAEPQSRVVRAAAHALGLGLHVLNASAERDFDAVFANLIELRARGLVIGGDAFFTSHSEKLAELTLRHGVPAVYQWRKFVVAGGLFSYGSAASDVHRLAGIYAGRILKGANPADLPVQQATKIELYINLKTAKALGLTIPLSIVGRADEVIE
jgi:putative tryptophan/tyrosine transport system substrate-binding protein